MKDRPPIWIAHWWLTDLTKKDTPNRLVWTPSSEKAFAISKQALCSSPILRNPDFNHQFILQSDASDRGFSAVLSQHNDDRIEHSVAYFSRKLLPRKQNYSTVEKESLAINLATSAFSWIDSNGWTNLRTLTLALLTGVWPSNPSFIVLNSALVRVMATLYLEHTLPQLHHRGRGRRCEGLPMHLYALPTDNNSVARHH